MPRYVALEWDHAEARVIVARTRSGQVDFEHAISVPLTGDSRSPADLGGKIHEALKQVGATGLEAIVAVGRANIELRFLSVPPVPPDELPDLVRFQASRQFSQPIEEGLLDYAPLHSSGDPPASVLAAAITPELLKTIREVCEAAHVTLKHLVLRPFAADSLVTDRLEAESCVITVDRLAEEVDLTVVLGGQAVFPRSVRVGNYGTAEDQAANIVGEMKRTIAAAQNQIAGHRVESVLILGRENEQQVLAETIARDLSLTVAFVDPVEAVNLSPGQAGQLPANISRFAPLVGALVDESRGRRHEIDFLSPRKRPPPADHRRRLILAGSLAGVVVLALLGMAWWQLSSLSGEIAELEQEKIKLDKFLKEAKPVVDKATLIDEYAAGQIPWLDELRELADDLPPGDKVILDKLTASAEGRSLVVVGGAMAAEEVPQLELKLSDDRHQVRGTGTAFVPQNAPYSASFNETIILVKPEDAPAAKRSGAGDKASSAAAAKGRKR
jgi:Tfp pilus assembly PilM family ATPase/Tfp pilus assembly protein PilN